ncbi:MAG: pantetheine-phosphate adenylyltransferase [Candidatus Kaiserbacteria bacterium]|nr:pantetheine-phosphate adenylyltransferase [Candidatus Kaiserbacteria bacterium]MCB9816631.1 pantetheine-phosphate adenylyltransferase [Candidatus Nomurabacteria bacterium]
MKAMYAASFDPITFGHLNIIERITPLYDEVILVVANQSKKTYTFSAEERAQMVSDSVKRFENISVLVCTDRYVVKLAESIGASVVVRGLRNSSDLQDEQALAEANRRIAPLIETIFLPCRTEFMHLSSSLVKSHVNTDPAWVEQVAQLVPPAVLRKLREKYS